MWKNSTPDDPIWWSFFSTAVIITFSLSLFLSKLISYPNITHKRIPQYMRVPEKKIFTLFSSGQYCDTYIRTATYIIRRSKVEFPKHLVNDCTVFMPWRGKPGVGEPLFPLESAPTWDAIKMTVKKSPKTWANVNPFHSYIHDGRGHSPILVQPTHINWVFKSL